MVIISFIFKDNRILIREKIRTKRQGSSGKREINAVVDPEDEPGGPRPPSFLDQTEAQRDDKKFLLDPHPLSQGLDEWAPLSEGLDAPLLCDN